MQARMDHPAVTVPGAMQALHGLSKAAKKSGDLPDELIELVNLRASQINGCSVCVQMHAKALKEVGQSDERIWGVAAWRETPYFTDAERAALALAESMTRVADRPDPVPDDIWDAAAKHYTQEELSGLLLTIATINVWNRLNAATRQIAGSHG
jgi:AhpD family alkylhydroperoxidase